jgi:hypothetical protein
MNWQTIFVTSLVIAAAGYVVWHLARGVFGFGGSGCGDCGTSKVDEFRQTQNSSGDATPDGFVASDDVVARDE